MMRTHRAVVEIFVFLIVALSLVAASASGADKKPNILLVVGDDSGCGDIGAYLVGNGRGIPTPNPDRLAYEAVEEV